MRHIVACLDGSDLAERVLPHAYAAASALGAPLTLLRVLDHAHGDQSPTDPMEWEIQRKEACQYLDRLAAENAGHEALVETDVIEGKAAEEICRWSGHHSVDLTIICTHGAGGCSPWAVASTARKLLDRAPGSLLLVPASSDIVRGPAHYRRVLMPLDGSARAESVFPIATQIATAHGAELLVAHVVPFPELTEFGPLDADDFELRDRLLRRNERAAHEYLDRLRVRLAENEVALRMLLIQGGDIASRLARVAVDEHVDLIVLSAHGRSARMNTPCGSVTADLISCSSIPLLIIRPRLSRVLRQVTAFETRTARLPHLATP